jgi:hypothetical protein
MAGETVAIKKNKFQKEREFPNSFLSFLFFLLSSNRVILSAVDYTITLICVPIPETKDPILWSVLRTGALHLFI